MPIDKNSCFCVVFRILWAFGGTMRFVLELAKKKPVSTGGKKTEIKHKAINKR